MKRRTMKAKAVLRLCRRAGCVIRRTSHGGYYVVVRNRHSVRLPSYGEVGPQTISEVVTNLGVRLD